MITQIKRGIIGVSGVIFLLGCGSSGNEESIQEEGKVVPVYNQAYQENFAADTLDEIFVNAKNAYVLVDPFTDDVTAEDIATIKSKNNQVAGYISAGTGEDWRDDFAVLEPYLTTQVWPEWPGEYFVNKTTTGIVDVMKVRIDKMAAWGLDWVEFDNMDWLDEETRVNYRLQVTVQEAKAYINALCDHTHAKGLKCMAKNSVEGFESFDAVLYESYDNEKNWWDEEGTKTFLNAGKIVIINHYNETDCDTVYTEYKNYYNSDKISFICEDSNLKRYKHYNEP